MTNNVAKFHINQLMSGAAKTRQGNCRVHGEFTDYMMPNGKWSGCGQCNIEEARGVSEVESDQRRRDQRKRSLEQLRQNSLIPKRFQSKRISDFEAKTDAQTLAKSVCNKYVARFEDRLCKGGGLIFYGSVGTGKSHLAYGIGNELLERGYSVMGIDVYELIDIVKESFSKDNPRTEREAIKEFVDLDLLIIDEIGAQLGTSYEDLLVFKIINERYKQVKPTVLISNLDHDSLVASLGERVYDRMQEGGGATVCFNWKSYRRNKNLHDGTVSKAGIHR